MGVEMEAVTGAAEAAAVVLVTGAAAMGLPSQMTDGRSRRPASPATPNAAAASVRQ